jgi:hypothetical protein
VLLSVKGFKNVRNGVKRNILQRIFLRRNPFPAPFIGVMGISAFTVNLNNIRPASIVEACDQFQYTGNSRLQVLRTVQRPQTLKHYCLHVVFVGCGIITDQMISHIHGNLHTYRPAIPFH